MKWVVGKMTHLYSLCIFFMNYCLENEIERIFILQMFNFPKSELFTLRPKRPYEPHMEKKQTKKAKRFDSLTG